MTLDQVIDLHHDYCLKKRLNHNREDIQKKIIEFIDSAESKKINERQRIFIVAKEFRQEVTASVLWLRSFGVDITCVKLTPYLLIDSTIAFESHILIPLPEAKDFIIQSEQKEKIEHELTAWQKEYLDFWNDLIKKMNTVLPLYYGSPTPRSYYQIRTKVPFIHFEWGFHGRSRNSFGVELHFESDKPKVNSSAIAKLEDLQKILEQKTNEKLIIQNPWGTKWARIYIERNDGTMSDELKNWAVQKMKIFYDTIQPELEKLSH